MRPLPPTFHIARISRRQRGCVIERLRPSTNTYIHLRSSVRLLLSSVTPPAVELRHDRLPTFPNSNCLIHPPAARTRSPRRPHTHNAVPRNHRALFRRRVLRNGPHLRAHPVTLHRCHSDCPPLCHLSEGTANPRISSRFCQRCPARLPVDIARRTPCIAPPKYCP